MIILPKFRLRGQTTYRCENVVVKADLIVLSLVLISYIENRGKKNETCALSKQQRVGMETLNVSSLAKTSVEKYVLYN